MTARWAPLLAAMLLACAGGARALEPLTDGQLAKVGGRDGIAFAVHLELNQHPGPAGMDSRITIGQLVDGAMTYLVIRNPSGIIDMTGLTLTARSAPDGTHYVALGLPSAINFTNVGFDSLSVQQDAAGPVSGNLGRFTLNGSWQMQGELRTWAH